MRRAHDADPQRIGRNGIGAEEVAAGDLGHAVDPLEARADRRAGGRRRDRQATSPPTSRPRRSCCSRCSGRARRPARPRPRRGWASRSGAKVPRPPSACPACRCRTGRRHGREKIFAVPSARRCRRPGPRPSRSVRPATWPMATRQAQTWRPSSSTVQAPQSPASQPTLVPVRPRSSRNADGQPRDRRTIPGRGTSRSG